MTDPKYGLTPEQAIEQMRANLDEMKHDPNRTQLAGTTPDEAFEMGYNYAIIDYLQLVSINPKEQTS